MLWTVLVFLVYLIRQSKQRWSYNWTEEIVDTKQVHTFLHLLLF